MESKAPLSESELTPLYLKFLRNHIRDKLKVELTKAAEDVINEVVEQALSDLEATIVNDYEHLTRRELIDVVVRRRNQT